MRAAPSDTESRFIVRMAHKQENGGGNDNFAYQSGNDIVVNGEGELQVFDLLGRFVMSRQINGLETVNVPSQGVYILRLVGDSLMTQKIIVK